VVDSRSSAAKFDAIPGYTNHTLVSRSPASSPATTFQRASGAELWWAGTHANMIAPRDRHEAEQFEAWLDRQRNAIRQAELPPAQRQAPAASTRARRPAADPHQTWATQEITAPGSPVPQVSARAVSRRERDRVGRRGVTTTDHKAHRDHVPGPHVRVLPAGRHRGAADPPCSSAARTTRCLDPQTYNHLITMHGTDDGPFLFVGPGHGGASRTTSCR